jgi:hypothetical protein
LVRDVDHFRVSGMNRILPFLDLWVHEGTDNELKIGNTKPIKLYRLAGNTLLRIRIDKKNLWSYLYLRATTV